VHPLQQPVQPEVLLRAVAVVGGPGRRLRPRPHLPSGQDHGPRPLKVCSDATREGVAAGEPGPGRGRLLRPRVPRRQHPPQRHGPGAVRDCQEEHEQERPGQCGQPQPDATAQKYNSPLDSTTIYNNSPTKNSMQREHDNTLQKADLQSKIITYNSGP